MPCQSFYHCSLKYPRGELPRQGQEGQTAPRKSKCRVSGSIQARPEPCCENGASPSARLRKLKFAAHFPRLLAPNLLPFRTCFAGASREMCKHLACSGTMQGMRVVRAALRGNGCALSPVSPPSFRTAYLARFNQGKIRMCIYRLEISVMGRTKNRNAVAAAAYRSGERLTDECDFRTKTAKTHDYRRKRGVVSTGIFLPEGACNRMTERAVLWNAAERAEKCKNSRVAREALIALPHELTDSQRRQAVERFARHLVSYYGVAADYAIHRPGKGADQRNHHAHVMFTTRTVTADGLAAKTRILDDKRKGGAEIEKIRALWERICNEALAAANITQRVDRRSLAARGINRLPEPKQGAKGTAIVRRGQPSKAIDEVRAVRAYNAAVMRCKASTRAIRIERDKATLKRLRRANRGVVRWLLVRAAEILKQWRGNQQQMRLRSSWSWSQKQDYHGYGVSVGTSAAVSVYGSYRLE